jgi:hypothetical protein
VSAYRLDGNTVHIDDPAAIARRIQDNPDLPLYDQRMLAALLLVSQRRTCPVAYTGITVDSFLATLKAPRNTSAS